MSNNKLKIQVGKKAFTEIITYGKDDQKFEWCAVTRKVDSDYEINFIDGVVSDWKMITDLNKALELVNKDWREYFNLSDG